MSVDVSVLTGLPGEFGRLTPGVAERLAGLGESEDFEGGEALLLAGDAALRFHAVVGGRLHLRLAPVGRPNLVVQSLRRGDLAGLSWFHEPRRWQWDVVAVEPSSTVAFDAQEVLAVCRADEAMELAVLRLLAAQMASRLTHSRLQLLDLFGAPV